jgi:hypothetical protein
VLPELDTEAPEDTGRNTDEESGTEAWQRRQLHFSYRSPSLSFQLKTIAWRYISWQRKMAKRSPFGGHLQADLCEELPFGLADRTYEGRPLP